MQQSSRFSRNTVDCLKYTRELKDLNIPVFFEKENINTLDTKGEVLMTIMAALAQQESESLSANVRLGIQYRNQVGKVQVNHNRFLGYTKNEEKKLVIVPEEAETVRRIFLEYLEGKSMLQIRRGLEKDRILNGAGNMVWHETNIKQILTNEKYIGDALLQKTYTLNTLEKKRVANDGYVPKYYVEGNHEAIIDKEVFLRVRAELVRRGSLSSAGRKRVYSSKFAMSGLVFCAHCGDIYRRIKWNNRGCRSNVWRCVSRLEKKECTARTIREEELQGAVARAVNDAWGRKDYVVSTLKENVRAVLEKGAERRLGKVETAIKKKQAVLLNTMEKSKLKKIEKELRSLQDKEQALLAEVARNRELQERVEEMECFLDEQNQEVEYSEALVRRLVKRIEVFDSKVSVEFKSGLVVDV